MEIHAAAFFERKYAWKGERAGTLWMPAQR